MLISTVFFSYSIDFFTRHAPVRTIFNSNDLNGSQHIFGFVTSTAGVIRPAFVTLNNRFLALFVA